MPKKLVSPSENFEKASGNLYDIKEPVVMICQKDFYNKKEKENTKKHQFQGQSARSMLWFDLGHEWPEETFCTHEPDFYINFYR